MVTTAKMSSCYRMTRLFHGKFTFAKVLTLYTENISWRPALSGDALSVSHRPEIGGKYERNHTE